MKRLFALIIGIILVLSGCANKDTSTKGISDTSEDTPAVEYKNKKLVDEMTEAFFDKDYSMFEEKVNEIQELYPDSMDYEMAKIYLNMYNDIKSDEKSETKNIDYKEYIQLLKVWTSEPNSAGGIDLYIKWKNVSNKTVKYAHFACDLYNAVDDRVACEIRNNYTFRGKVTGPIESGQVYGDNTYWDAAWYNNSGNYPKIIEIELEYMDGSKVIIPKNRIDELFY